MTGGSTRTYVNVICGVDSLALYDTLALPCYTLHLSFTLCISQINDSEYMQIQELFVLGRKHEIQAIIYIQNVPEEVVNILTGHSISYSKQKKCICTCVLLRTVSKISLYCCKIVDKKEILRTVSNASIYCSSDEVGTVYLVQYIFENSTFNINVPYNSYEDMPCCAPECTLTFLYAGDNLHYVIKQFVWCISFFSAHFTLHPTP